MKKIFIFLLSAVVIGILFFAFRSYQYQDKVPQLGFENGSFVPCPDKPNCVSTLAEDSDHMINPLENAKQLKVSDVEDAIKDMGGQILRAEDNYVQAVFYSSIFKYPDDLEVLLDEEENMFHFRSASRVGHSDMGVNRARVNTLKQILK